MLKEAEIVLVWGIKMIELDLQNVQFKLDSSLQGESGTKTLVSKSFESYWKLEWYKMIAGI